MREQDESETAYMKRCFKEIMDEEGLDRVEDELKEEGYKIENIRPRKSERRQELKKQTKALAKTVTGALTPEALVELLPAPTDVDGRVDGVFVAGMKYEALNIIRGIRLAQELSKMAIDQASPVIRMAQEMRAAEGKSADEAARVAAASVGAQILPEFEALKSLVASQGGNPMAALMMSMMAPSFQQAGKQFAKLFGATQPIATSQPETGGEQQPSQQWTPPNVEQHSISEWEG